MVVEKLKEREDKRDEERDKVHNPDLEQRVIELEEENKELKTKINRVIDLFNRWDSSDLYDYIDDLDYEKI